MQAAILQGVMVNTMDWDIWVDLPSRQYIRLWNLVRRLGGSAISQTLYHLEDGRVVNFLFHVDGLQNFASEYRRSLRYTIDGLKVSILPLGRLLKSKKAIRRDKDLAHIPLIERALRAQKLLKGKQ